MASSRRKSDRRSPTPALHDYEFFAERSLDSASFVNPLVAAGLRVHRFFQHVLQPDAEDGIWIKYAAERGWISLTGDRDIGSIPEEIEDVMKCRARVLVLTFGHGTNHPILAENFLRTGSRIASFLRQHRAPYIAKINRPTQENWMLGKPGEIRMYRTHADWLAHRHRRRR